jgi:hypothetical protein
MFLENQIKLARSTEAGLEQNGRYEVLVNNPA